VGPILKTFITQITKFTEIICSPKSNLRERYAFYDMCQNICAFELAVKVRRPKNT
jgi:hypothetical protein